MPIRHVPFWLDRVPKTRRPAFPRACAARSTPASSLSVAADRLRLRVVVCGRRVKVVLLEAEAIGGGATAGGPGLVREDFDASFQETASAHGLRAARSLWQAMRRASLDFPAALRRLAVKCDLGPAGSLDVAPPRSRSCAVCCSASIRAGATAGSITAGSSRRR